MFFLVSIGLGCVPALLSVICTCLILILVGSLFLQVWYPSLGADPFKQEDFLQVCVYIFKNKVNYGCLAASAGHVFM